MRASYRAIAVAAIAGWLTVGTPGGVGAVDAAAPPAAVEDAATAPLRAETLAALRASLFPGRAPEELRAIRVTAILEQGGRPVGRAETVAERRPRKLRETLTLGDVRQVATVIGDEAWREDPNGGVREVTGNERMAFVLSHHLLFHRYLETARVPAEFAVRAVPDGLELHPEDGGHPRRLDIHNLPFDGHLLTLPHVLHERIQGADVTTTFEDWRLVDGVRFPFRSIHRTGDPRFDLVIRVESIAIMDELPENALARPRPGQPSDARILDAERASAIPLRFVGSLALVDVSLEGGDPVPFLLDTGSAATVLDRSAVRALGLETRGTLEARGAGGSEAAAFVTVEVLRLPGIVLENQTLVTVDLGALTTVLGREVGGILGYDFFSRFAVEIDAGAERLALARPGAYRPPPGAHHVPLRIEANVPFVRASLEGAPAADFVFDTGNAAGLLVHSPYAAQHDLLARAGEARELAGIGGAEALRELPIARLVIGPVVLENVTALVSSADRGIASLEEAAGNLGSALFPGGLLAFDYVEASLWIRPAQAASASER